MKSTTLGRNTAWATRWPPIMYGEITRLAPAFMSFFSAPSSSARATMNTRSDINRALMVMKRLSASEAARVTSVFARSMPARRRVSSWVASPASATPWSALKSANR